MAELTEALRPGGMVPELRARRLQEIADRAEREFGGRLRLEGPIPELRKALKKVPNIADPGADRILLFAGIAPIAAVPSNCPHVLIRIQHGQAGENYGLNYRQAQEAIALEVPENVAARQRAYLLLKRHGQEICKRANPKCEACPVNAACAYYAGRRRGRAASSYPARRQPPSGCGSQRTPSPSSHSPIGSPAFTSEPKRSTLPSRSET
jgi:endonuclease-3